jgi:hypothetical protein
MVRVTVIVRAKGDDVVLFNRVRGTDVRIPTYVLQSPIQLTVAVTVTVNLSISDHEILAILSLPARSS